MVILALDPGTFESSWVIYNPDGTKSIVNKGSGENDKLLGEFFNKQFEDFIDAVAIEMVECQGMPVGKTTLMTCVWIGEFSQYFKSKNTPVSLIPRGEIKMHLCGSRRAKDANIRQALIDRFGLPGTKKSPGLTYGISKHTWQALAVAITFADSLKEKKT